MNTRQTRGIESLRRIEQFAEVRRAGPEGTTTDPLFTALVGRLSAAIDEVEGHAATQYAGTQTARQRKQDRDALMADLRRQYLLPLKGYAEALATDPAYQLELERYRVPSANAKMETLRAAARGMLANATESQAALVARGMPADFLERFAAALAQFQRASAEQTAERTRVVQSSRGLVGAIDRAWAIVKELDLYFRTRHPVDKELLGTWREVSRRRTAPRLRKVEVGAVAEKVSPLPVGGDAQRPAA